MWGRRGASDADSFPSPRASQPGMYVRGRREAEKRRSYSPYLSSSGARGSKLHVLVPVAEMVASTPLTPTQTEKSLIFREYKNNDPMGSEYRGYHVLTYRRGSVHCSTCIPYSNHAKVEWSVSGALADNTYFGTQSSRLPTLVMAHLLDLLFNLQD